MQLLGISGYKGSGKDTAFTMIKADCPFRVKRFAFADLLKEELRDEMGLDMDILHGTTEQKDTTYTDFDWEHPRFDWIREEGKSGKITYREMLTIWGSMKGCTYWVDKLLDQLYAYHDEHPEDLLIVTDVRFPLEAETIVHNGGYILRIDGKQQGDFLDHASENADFHFDYVVPGRGKASKSKTKHELHNVMWSAFGINCKGK